MREIDENINGENRAPDGDDYNLLYDAMLDEIKAFTEPATDDEQRAELKRKFLVWVGLKS